MIKVSKKNEDVENTIRKIDEAETWFCQSSAWNLGIRAKAWRSCGTLAVRAGAVSNSLAFFWDPFLPTGLSHLALLY